MGETRQLDRGTRLRPTVHPLPTGLLSEGWRDLQGTRYLLWKESASRGTFRRRSRSC